MLKILVSIWFLVMALGLNAQSFEIINTPDANITGFIGEIIKVPLHLKNNSDKTTTLVVRRVSAEIGSSQKNYYCIDDNCLDAKVDDYIIKLNPGETISSVNIALEAGLTHAISELRYVVFNKSNPADLYELNMNFSVDERTEKPTIYSSSAITLKDVYPNPIIDNAFVDYQISDDEIKAKIVIHNILGNIIETYPLLSSENKLKIRADGLNAGIYFYTLYIDNEGVITRKLVVKK
ncbi:MAG TPA: T9SS type A sorting domain-containing protein [Chryseosolibacter sp.]|nr:T9SS type A sorting domain-containing protein [Chryseosolibacter sp.]